MCSQPGLRTTHLERLCDMIKVHVNILLHTCLDVVHGELKKIDKCLWDRKERLSGVLVTAAFCLNHSKFHGLM